jgi:hypothetical protein
MFKFPLSTVVKEKKSGGFYRIVDTELKPILFQGSDELTHHKSYIIIPLFGPKTKWSVDEENLELPVDFPTRTYVSPVKKKRAKKIIAPIKNESTRWQALLKVCEQAFSLI